MVRPPIMSWAKGMSLSEQFFVQGTRDHIPFLCAKHGLQFYQAIGGMVRVFVLSKVVVRFCYQRIVFCWWNGKVLL